MAEYIEREALLAELQEEIDFESPCYNAEQNKYFTMGLRCAYRAAQRFPAADVVEVVRCRDCRYLYDPRYDDTGWCDYHEATMELDNFCEDGRKRG